VLSICRIPLTPETLPAIDLQQVRYGRARQFIGPFILQVFTVFFAPVPLELVPLVELIQLEPEAFVLPRLLV